MTNLRLRGAAALVVLLAWGCGSEKRPGGDAAGGAGGTPEAGGTAVVAEAADMNIPIAMIANTELDGALGDDVLNMQMLRGVWRDGHLEFVTAAESPLAIARSYELLDPDSAAVRFHMRSEVRWSDGQPLTARDVAYTYRLLKDPDLASPQQEYGERIDSVAVENDSTVVFHFSERYPEMLAHASISPLPQHLFGDTPAGEIRTHPAVVNPAGGKLVTSGPWVIGEWTKGQRVVLRPNPYFSPKPHLAQIAFRIIPDPTTRLVELQTGGVDVVKRVATDKVASLRAQPGIRLEREQKRSYDYVAYSPEGFPAFADPEIRRALTLGIDAQRLIEGLSMGELAVPAGGPYPPVFDLYDPELMPPVKYDPEEAKRILAAKGWRDTDGDGVLDRDGQPLRFTLVTNSGSQTRADASLVVQQMWKRIGVDAQLRQLEFNTFTSNLLKHDYQAALGGWNAGLTPDFLAILYGEGSPFNITGYANPEVAAMLEQAQRQPTAELARSYWQQAAVRIARDQPYTWLYYQDTVDAVRDRLRNTRIDTYGAYQNTWEWWIPRAQQRGAAPGGSGR